MFRHQDTKVVNVGGVKIGGGNPIAIQSMTNTKTADVKATVEQILRLEEAGCEIIRCTVPDQESAEALAQIKKQIHIPLVADMSSCIISEPIDVSKFGLIYAGAQKNMAPAGLTLVIVREDLLGKAREDTPAMFDYKLMADNDSMYNTPPCYCIYIAKLVYEWILSLGGLEAMKERNEKKAKLLYDYLDSQDYYIAPVEKESRSMMNVTFVTGDAELDKKFASEASAAGLKNLKGHRSVGGMRASIYNAMPYEGVEALVAFMKEFAKNNPKA